MYCTNCGTKFEGKFCPNCGTPAGASVPVSPEAKQSDLSREDDDDVEKVLWEGAPSSIGGKLKSSCHLNGVKYKVTNQRIIVENGLIGKHRDEIELGMVKDYKVSQTLLERAQNIGDVMIISSDPSAEETTLNNVESPEEVKEIIRSAVMSYKKRMGITRMERI